MNEIRPDRRRIILRHGAVEYDAYGSANTPTVLLLHGFLADRTTWTATASRLAQSHRVLVPDLPGHGSAKFGSASESHTLDVVAEVIDTILAREQTRALDLIGYATGGRAALYYAATRADRVQRLILESASPGLRDESERQDRVASDRALAARVLHHGVESFVDDWEAMALFATQSRLPLEVTSAQRQLRLSNSPHSIAAGLVGMGLGAHPSMWERLDSVRARTLLVSGALDEQYTDIASAMSSAMPNAISIAVPNAGHNVHQEQPEIFSAVAERFLTRAAPVAQEPTASAAQKAAAAQPRVESHAA